MAFEYLAYRCYIKKGDKKRNNAIKEPEGVKSLLNVTYDKRHGKWGKLDAFRPINKDGELPLLVIVHGGGWIYGDKEIYHLYAKDMARRGFVVICFNYVRAPEKRFPFQIEEIDKVLVWAKEHAKAYGCDLNNVFLVGDSAGAQLSAQYAAIKTNPIYAKLFNLTLPLPIRGLLLACGVYDRLGGRHDKEEDLLWKYYLPHKGEAFDPRYETLAYITKDFPPCYLFTAEKDIPFVTVDNKTMVKRLEEVGIPFTYRLYTSKEGNKLQHVFHCTIDEEHAIQANDDQAEFVNDIVQGKPKYLGDTTKSSVNNRAK